MDFCTTIYVIDIYHNTSIFFLTDPNIYLQLIIDSKKTYNALMWLTWDKIVMLAFIGQVISNVILYTIRDGI